MGYRRVKLWFFFFHKKRQINILIVSVTRKVLMLFHLVSCGQLELSPVVDNSRVSLFAFVCAQHTSFFPTFCSFVLIDGWIKDKYTCRFRSHTIHIAQTRRSCRFIHTKHTVCAHTHTIIMWLDANIYRCLIVHLQWTTFGVGSWIDSRSVVLILCARCEWDSRLQSSN